MTMHIYDCQDGDLRRATEPVTRAKVLTARAIEHLRNEGLASLLRRASAFGTRRMRRVLRIRKPVVPAVLDSAVALGLQQGDWVEVKGANEIRSTLDSTGRNRGLGFMAGMLQYCGKRLRVYKRAETIILEGTGETRRLKNTVLLDGAICDGENLVCDRSCFYFWKESWLTRVSDDADNCASPEARAPHPPSARPR